MDMSQPDDDGVYRNGATKRKARTELAMQCLTELWNAACKDARNMKVESFHSVFRKRKQNR